MKGILKARVAFKEPLALTKQSDLRRLEELVERDVDALIWSGGGSIYSCRKLAKLSVPIIIWGGGGYATAAAWDRRGFLESEGVEAYTPFGISEYDRIIRILGTPGKLKRSKAMIFGSIPNKSLFSSCWDLGMLERKIGVEVAEFSNDKLLQEFDTVTEGEGKEVLNSWQRNIERLNGPGEERLLEVARLYVAYKRVIEREGVDAVAVDCNFSPHGIMRRRFICPCLPMAVLIDEGIMVACEPDLNALLTMQLLHHVSGQASLMGNVYFSHPSAPGFPPEGKTMDDYLPEELVGGPAMQKLVEANMFRFTHCVIPLSMCTSGFVVEDYHGQERGLTAYGQLKEGVPVTVARWSADLEKLLAIRGHLVRAIDSIHCRFSAWIKVENLSAVAQNSFSLHHAMVYGDHTESLKALEKKLGMEVIVV